MTTMTARQDMRTKMLRAAMTLAVMLMATVSAWAETMFITDVMLLGGSQSDVDTQKRALMSEGWIFIDQDLNEGAGGDYIYLLYKESVNTNEYASFITGFYIDTTEKHSENTADTRTVYGRTYHLVPTAGSSDFKKYKGNLNNGVKGSAQIHLYYTKASFGDQNAVKSITFNSTQEGALGNDGGTTGYDLNKDCGKKSAYIYMHVDKSKGWIVNMGAGKCVITGYEGLTLEYTSIEIPTEIDKATVLNFSSDFSFSEFKNLEEMTFPEESVIDYMPSVQGLTKFKKVVGYVNRFGGGMSDNALPTTITNVPAYTFVGTAIEDLGMLGVSYIGTGAFEGCNRINDIFIGNSAEIRSRAFANNSSSGTVQYDGPLSNLTPDIYLYSPNLTFKSTFKKQFCGWCGSNGSNTDNLSWLCWTLEETESSGVHTYMHLAISSANNKWQTNPKEQVIKTSTWKKQVNKYSHISSLTTEHVYALGANEFKDYTDLESVELKDGITSIGASAFGGCTALTSATITGNPAIGKDAFPDGTTLTLNLSANDAEGEKWMTFYNDYANFQADASTKVYKATVSGTGLVLTEVEDRIVNAGTAVILRSSSDPVMTRTATASSDTHSNDLVGTMTATVTPANAYTLANGSQGLGFYHFTGSNVAAGKAYLIYSGASAARSYIGFNETTGIVKMDDGRRKKEDVDGAWYDLDGRKLQGEPKDKGLYIKDGNKVVVK